MKKVTLAVIGVSLFVAGHNYTRRQAEYVATKGIVTSTSQIKKPTILPFKSLLATSFKSSKSF